MRMCAVTLLLGASLFAGCVSTETQRPEFGSRDGGEVVLQSPSAPGGVLLCESTLQTHGGRYLYEQVQFTPGHSPALTLMAMQYEDGFYYMAEIVFEEPIVTGSDGFVGYNGYRVRPDDVCLSTQWYDDATNTSGRAQLFPIGAGRVFGQIPRTLAATMQPLPTGDTCPWANDGECDDDRYVGAVTNACPHRTDMTDCQGLSMRSDELASGICEWANDGECDDTRYIGAVTGACQHGTDVDDCQHLEMRPVAELVGNSCQWAFDGECDEPGYPQSLEVCAPGTDTHDCGGMSLPPLGELPSSTVTQ